MRVAPRIGSVAALLLIATLAGCAAAPQYVLTVKFKSKLAEAEIRERFPTRMPAYRALPGLVQKYYLHDAQTGEWSGILIWDSMEAVEQYMQSDLKKTVPEVYEIVGQPRVELLQVVEILR